jgi:hypothetical protein
METKEWRYVDKSKWGDGEWQDEPDKKQWIDEATGLPCLIVRGPSGALCGYVGVPKSHPFYGLDYSAKQHENGTCEDGEDYCFHYRINVDVHGGLTFADKCQPGENERGICHIVEPGEDDDAWWLGFDCAHSGDLCPAHSFRSGFGGYGEYYRDLPYVTCEVQSLAKQLAEATHA